jgi:hypothetical protein
MIRSQPGQIVLETLSLKKKSLKRAVGVAQGVGPEFKSQYAKKKKKDEHENKATALWLIKHENNLGFRG